MLPYELHISRQMKGLTDVPGIRVGHASDYDALTGCTVILCESGAAGGVDVRGSATGTEELELLRPQHLTERIHAIVFSGGSAFGLETCSGVRRYLEHKGVGFPTGAARVPLVPGAILYDLGIGKAGVRPTREMGEAAAAAATADAVVEGAVGAGTGATVGKVLGMKCAMKSGVGSWTVPVASAQSGVVVSALAVVNAVGDVIDPKTGDIVAGTRRAPDTMDFADSARLIRDGAQAGFRRENTTLVAVATNAGTDEGAGNQVGAIGFGRDGARHFAGAHDVGRRCGGSAIDRRSDGECRLAGRGCDRGCGHSYRPRGENGEDDGRRPRTGVAPIAIALLVPEVADAGEDHRQPEPVGRGDHLVIADRSAGLYHRRDSSPGSFLDAIGEREESIGRKHRSLDWQDRFHRSDLYRVDAAHLPRSRTDDLPGSRINNSVRLHVLHDFPPEQQRAPFVF